MRSKHPDEIRSESSFEGEVTQRVLFVTEDATARQLFERTMSRNGFVVDLAEGGIEALRMATQRPYCVVATSDRLRDIDATTLVERIQSLRPQTAFVLLTNSPSIDTGANRRLGSATCQVVFDPWDEHALIHTITRAMELGANDIRPSYGSILLLEDNEADAHLIRHHLKPWLVREDVDLKCVDTLKDATRALYDEDISVVLADLSLPDAAGLEAVRRLYAAAPGTAIIVLTGLDDDELGMRAIQLGAQDYLSKNLANRTTLARTIRYAFERKQAAERLSHLAYHDQLTGLANRSLFGDRLQHAITVSRRSNTRFAVLFVDLDSFKPVNDTYGHDVGDELIQEVAYRLRTTLRAGDTVARFGGDEFALLAVDLQSADAVDHILTRLAHALNIPVRIGERELTVSASIGVAHFPESADSVAGLLKCADQAMYVAKVRAGTTWEIHTPTTSRSSLRSLA